MSNKRTYWHKKPRKGSFTEQVVSRKKTPVENFHVVGEFPKGLSEEVMVVLRPTDTAKQIMGKIKAAAFNRNGSYKIFMGGDLGDEMVALLGNAYKKFMWVSQDGSGKAIFDPEKPVPKELCW